MNAGTAEGKMFAVSWFVCYVFCGKGTGFAREVVVGQCTNLRATLKNKK